MELSGYQIYGAISEVDKAEFQNILNQNVFTFPLLFMQKKIKKIIPENF